MTTKINQILTDLKEALNIKDTKMTKLRTNTEVEEVLPMSVSKIRNMISERAYFMWKDAGKPLFTDGKEFWFAAEKELFGDSVGCLDSNEFSQGKDYELMSDNLVSPG